MMNNKRLLRFALLASIAAFVSSFLSMPGAVSAHSAEPRIQYENDVSSSSENTEKAEEEKNNTDEAGEDNASETDDTSDTSPDEKILGDVNSDGTVTKDDAEILSEYIKGNITCDDLDLSVADVNRDRRIDQRDCVNIRRYVDGKRCSPGIGRKLSDIDTGTIVAGHHIPPISSNGMLYKPVIYLYPTQKTDVFVNLSLDGKVTCTYPKINEGWHVIAEPDGTLTDKNGRTYGYLFWEGDTKVHMDLSEGFCVAGKDTEAFLLDKLSYLGLNDKEINDFIVFWLPRMQDNPYNVIAFQKDNYLGAAKLDVAPQPDTVIRVFMAWKRFDNFVTINPQKLERVQRKGFSIVEWGGTEVKSGNSFSVIQ